MSAAPPGRAQELGTCAASGSTARAPHRVIGAGLSRVRGEGPTVRRVRTVDGKDAAPADWPANAPLGITLHGPDLNADVQMLVALGAVVRASAQLEAELRRLFCALQDSKYAAVTAAGQSAQWLLDMNKALLHTRREEIPEAPRSRIVKLLEEAGQGLGRRNRYVHDQWGHGAEGETHLMRSQRRSHDLHLATVDRDGVVATVQQLTRCAVEIGMLTLEALGPEAAAREVELRWAAAAPSSVGDSPTLDGACTPADQAQEHSAQSSLVRDYLD
jgi:hypothetical protein